MKIFGTYKNTNNVDVEVVIYNTDLADVDDIEIGGDNVKFAADAVTIEQDGDDLFEPLRTRSATIRLESKIYLGDYLYAANYNSIIVNIFRDSECVFAGVVTPAAYNQGFAQPWETVEIECVDVLSTLQKRSYVTDGANYDTLKNELGTITFKDMLNLLKSQRYAVANLPALDDEMTQEWQEYNYRLTDEGNYVAVERKITVLDANSAVATTLVRDGQTLTVTLVQGANDDLCNVDGLNYYKNYKYVTINGVATNTGDWEQGAAAPMPTVVSESWVVDGPVRVAANDYYEHEVKMLTLSDGRVISGNADRVGNQLTPSTVVGAADDLMESGGDWCYKSIPYVTVNGQKTYYDEDATPWRVVGATGQLEGFIADPLAFDINVDGSTERIFPDNVQNIEGFYFFSSNALNTLDLSELMKNNTRVRHITHLDALTGDPADEMVLDDAFNGCSNLITASLTTDYVATNSAILAGCEALTRLTIDSTVSMLSVTSSDMEDVSANCVVYAPSALVDDYRADDVWNNYIIVEMSEL